VRSLGNAIVFIFGGGIVAAIWLFFAGVAYLSIIGIPFARSFIEFAKIAAFPFGQKIVRDKEAAIAVKGARKLFNILWFPIGVLMFFLHLVLAVEAALTVIGIPVAVMHLKMGKFLLFPMGARVKPAN
jgi:uncharacterized membrane protein YccF (DUF307 family)